MVLIGVDKQLAESVTVGSVTVMMLVTVKGSVIDEPVDASITVLKKKHENARQRVDNGGF
jgi:hypothetical protein